MSSTGPAFKFTFRVSSSSGGAKEYKNLPRVSLTADELRKLAREFFDGIEHFIARAEKAHSEIEALREKLTRKKSGARSQS